MLLRRTSATVAQMKTMENETTLQVAIEAGERECQVLIRQKLGEPFPAMILRTVEGDIDAVRRLLGKEAVTEDSSSSRVSNGLGAAQPMSAGPRTAITDPVAAPDASA